MPFAGVSSVAVRSEMKHGSSQRHVALTLNRRYARVDDQESINYQTMTPDTFVFPQSRAASTFAGIGSGGFAMTVAGFTGWVGDQFEIVWAGGVGLFHGGAIVVN